METIGQKIERLRLDKGYTYEELGELVGVGKSTVRKWEKGIIENIKRSNLEKLASALDVSVEEFFYTESQTNKLSEGIRQGNLLKKYNLLTEHNKQVVDMMIDSLLNAQE